MTKKRKDSPLEKAAMRCVDKKGYAFRIATESIARTYFINERAFLALEEEVEKRRHAKRGRK